MADTVLERLVVKLGADFSELDAALGQLGGKVSSRIERASSAIKAAGGIITAGITVPIVGMGVASIKASSDFESSFATVRKSVDATEPEFEKLRQGIRDMAKEMPASASEIAKVAGEAGQLGIAQKDLLAFTETAIKLGTVTNMSASDAGKGLARLANIMQLPSKEAQHLADELVYLGNKGASTESEIMAMSLRIAGAGKVIGLSVDEVMAWANAASSVGLRAEQGGSAISRTFIDVANAVRGIEPAKEDLEKVFDATEKVAQASHDMAMAQRGVRDAQEAVQSASRGVRDAHEAVTTATRQLRDANEGVVQSQRAVRDAQEGVTSAQRSARNATEALGDAYRNLARAQRDQRQASLDARRETLSVLEAQQSLTELQTQAGAHTLDVKDAQLALVQAQNDLRDASKKGGLEQQQATLRVEQAQMRLNQVMAQGPKYALDLANAQLRLAEAQNRVGSAAEKWDDQQRQLNRDVRNSAEGVQDAQRGVRNAAEGVGIANTNLKKSYEGVSDAQKAQRNATEGVADAQKQLRDATEGVGDAQYNVQQTTKKYNVSQRELGDITEKVYGKLDTFAKTAGMSSEAFAALFKANPSQAILRFLEGLDQMNKSGGDVLGTLDKVGISEVRQRDAVLRLAGANDVLKQSLIDATQAGGAADEAYRKRTETFNAQFDIFKNKITDVFITLGDALLPIIINVMDAVEPLISLFALGAKIFAGLPKPIQMVVVALLLLVAAIGPLLIILGAMIPGIYALVVFLPILAPMFIALLGPIGLLVIAITAFALGLYLLQQHADEMKDAVIGAFNTVLDFLTNNWKDIVVTLVAGPFVMLVVKAANAFGVTDALKSAFRSAFDWIKQAVLDIVAFIVDKFKYVKNSLNDLKSYADPRNLPKNLKNLGGGLIPSFDVGSAYVPNDMLAFVHKGEAIIPASQNGLRGSTSSGPHGGGNGAAAVAINGPVTIQNIGGRQDAKGALNTLGFGISNALQRRGV